MLSDPLTERCDACRDVLYILSRMEWYWNLVLLFLAENEIDEFSVAAMAMMETSVRRLYEIVLLYQIRSACLCSYTRAAVVFRDAI